MNLEQIKKQLAEKGTPINDFQAIQIQTSIEKFCASMQSENTKTDWHYDIQQVSTDAFSIAYCHRETVEIKGDSISPLQ